MTGMLSIYKMKFHLKSLKVRFHVLSLTSCLQSAFCKQFKILVYVCVKLLELFFDCLGIVSFFSCCHCCPCLNILSLIKVITSSGFQIWHKVNFFYFIIKCIQYILSSVKSLSSKNWFAISERTKSYLEYYI